MAAPLGNRNAAKAKRWETALTKALTRYSDDKVKAGEALDYIAGMVVKKAVNGSRDAWDAILEIANRMDGKPMQQVEMDATVRNTDVSSEPLSPDEWISAYGSPPVAAPMSQHDPGEQPADADINGRDHAGTPPQSTRPRFLHETPAAEVFDLSGKNGRGDPFKRDRI